MQTILVIEDEPAIRANILKLLGFKGFQAIGAEDGAAGVQLAKVHLPDLIICDILMPNLDGYGVLTALRQNPDTTMIPFIFLSAKVDRPDIRRGMNLGADDYLTKPFTSAELFEAIAARLEKQVTVTQPYVDEMKLAAENLSKVALCDPLTNLPNRMLLRRRLQEALGQIQRQKPIAPFSEPETPQQSHSPPMVAVLYLNIDGFRTVNTILGHSIGDLLLRAVADRLTQCVNQQDTVARISGDEFGLIRTGVIEDMTELAQSVLDAIAQPYALAGQEVQIKASIGIALYPQDGDNPDKLLTRADAAGRWCQKQGGGSYQFYSPTLDASDAEQRSLETDLSLALERSEFQLYYQPQVNLTTGRMIGMEALLRWQHAERGAVSPDRFIPVAEETGLIIPLGEWVLRTACAQAQIWQTLSLIPLQIAVNLSARQLKQQNLVAMITQVLQQTGLDPKLLVLELTETSVMEDVNATIAILQELKAKGIKISIDDFGTGYSSLNYLRRFPIDILKIDRSFVNQVNENAHDAAIATAIIAMAQSLRLKVVAEGVETEAQLAFLRQQGCQAMQGYLYSRPLPAIAIGQLLTEDRRLPSPTPANANIVS